LLWIQQLNQAVNILRQLLCGDTYAKGRRIPTQALRVLFSQGQEAFMQQHGFEQAMAVGATAIIQRQAVCDTTINDGGRRKSALLVYLGTGTCHIANKSYR
jgi:hypothetical protein